MNQDKPIARMREKMGLTQVELSQLVGVSENTIANWEKGGASKWIRHLGRLCKILNCGLEDLALEEKTQEVFLRDLTPAILDTLKSYCIALLSKDKKAVVKIASFATLHDRSLRYWLNQVEQIIEQNEYDLHRKIDCEVVVNSLILQNLSIQLSYSLPSQVTLESFRDLVKKIRLSYDFLKRYIRFSKEHFSRKLILQTRYLSVYIIGWEPGQESYMHHHGNSLDAIWVVEGEMTHWLLSPEECKKENIPFEGCESGQKILGKAETFLTGDWVFIDRLCAHQIANLSKRRLTTLHIRFGAPPDDDNWEVNEHEPAIIWQQIEHYQVLPA